MFYVGTFLIRATSKGGLCDGGGLFDHATLENAKVSIM
jgi:hypothetical protein